MFLLYIIIFMRARALEVMQEASVHLNIRIFDVLVERRRWCSPSWCAALIPDVSFCYIDRNDWRQIFWLFRVSVPWFSNKCCQDDCRLGFADLMPPWWRNLIAVERCMWLPPSRFLLKSNKIKRAGIANVTQTLFTRLVFFCHAKLFRCAALRILSDGRPAKLTR